MSYKKLQQQLESFRSDQLEFDTLIDIKTDFEELFRIAKLYRKCSVTLLLNGYDYIKSAKKSIDNLVRYRLTNLKLGLGVTNAITKLNLLFHRLSETGIEYQHHDRELRKQLHILLEKLGGLLPKDYGVQLDLFDDSLYQSKPRLLDTFEQWLGRQPRQLASNYRYQPSLTARLKTKQLSIPLWQPACPTDAQDITLRQARKLAGLMGFPQKVGGKDLSLKAFLHGFRQQWFYSSRQFKEQFRRSLLELSI